MLYINNSSVQGDSRSSLDCFVLRLQKRFLNDYLETLNSTNSHTFQTSPNHLPPCFPRLCLVALLLADEWFLATFALKCSSWCMVNRGTSGRGPCCSLGNGEYSSVQEANRMGSRILGFMFSKGSIFLSFFFGFLSCIKQIVLIWGDNSSIYSWGWPSWQWSWRPWVDAG